MIQIDKTILDLNTLSFKRLEESGLSVSAGRIAKLLLSVMNENIAEFYTTLKNSHAQAFLSTATGQSLDFIGQLLNVIRENTESDEDYRYRISQQSLTLATSNETAIRLGLLSITGIDNVIMKPYTHGPGSFSAYIINQDNEISDELIAEAQAKVDEIKAAGIKGKVYQPIYISAEIKMRLTFSKNLSEIDKKIIRVNAQEYIRNYIYNLQVGEGININNIETEVKNINPEILSIYVYEFTIAGKPRLWSNQNIQWNEKFIESSNADAILVS